MLRARIRVTTRLCGGWSASNGRRNPRASRCVRGGVVVSGLKSDEAAEGVDGWSVFVAVESAEHSGEVGGGGDRRSQPAADRLA